MNTEDNAMYTTFHTMTRQRGAATLVVAIILLLAMTMMTFFGVRVGVTEQRIAANDMRAKQALAVAEALVENGIAYLDHNKAVISKPFTGTAPDNDPHSWLNGRWQSCASTAVPCGYGTTNHGYVCTGLISAPPCGNGTTNIYDKPWLFYMPPAGQIAPVSDNIIYTAAYTESVSFVTPNKPNKGTAAVPPVDPFPEIHIIANVTPGADPLAGSAVIRQIVQDFSLLNNVPRVPIASGGVIELKGGTSVYGDPNPDRLFYTSLGSGMPLSLWSGSGVTITSAAAATCQPAAPNCTGTNKLSSRLSSADPKKPDGLDNVGDIVANDGKFPLDLFEHIFGVRDTDAVRIIKTRSTVLTNCDDLTSDSSGLFWITGSCSIGSIGSQKTPAILVVDGAEVSMVASGVFYGIIYFRNDGVAGGKVTLGGSAVLHGGLAAQFAPEYTMTGNPTFRYLDFSSQRPTRRNVFAKGFAKVPGGWLDQL